MTCQEFSEFRTLIKTSELGGYIQMSALDWMARMGDNYAKKSALDRWGGYTQKSLN